MNQSQPSENTLSKSERLSEKSGIVRLVREGHYCRFPGMRYCFYEGNGLDYNRILISVPKRYFKRAVKRNLLKRRIRDAYRTQKSLLTKRGVDIMFLYDQKEVLSTAQLHEQVARILTEVNTHE